MSVHLNVLNHAIVQHHLVCLRDRTTRPDEFRRRLQVLAGILAAEGTRDLPMEPVSVLTPLEETTGMRLCGRIAIVPILRAGLALVDAMLELIPEAEVHHIGLYRDEDTAQPVRYYEKLPANNPPDLALVLDPMLATGGSAVETVRTLENWGVNSIRMLSIIAAPEGVERMNREYPDVQLFTCALDRELNEQKFILPGLGDAGDRVFNT